MSGETRRLDENLEDNDPTQPVEQETSPTPLKALPAELKLQIASTGDMIVVPVKSTIIVGRKDPTQRIQPDLDLTPYRAYQCGVSRSHAVIVVKENDLWIRALSAANGTYLNEVMLTTGQEQLLRSGDELRLGVLRLRLTFVSAPAASTT